MGQCSCWKPLTHNARCYGTKEAEYCSCGGDESKCDFYPEKRKMTCELYVGGTSPVGEKFHWCSRSSPFTKCECEGDYSQCPVEKDDERVISTAAMWFAAQENGRTYYSGDMAYSVANGLHDPSDKSPWPMDAFDSFETLMNYEWREFPTMTRAAAETKFRVKIID